MAANYDKSVVLSLMDKLSFFGQFTREEKSELAGFEHIVLRFDIDEPIIRQGDEDTSLFVLLKGEAEVVKKEAPGVTLARLLPGAVLGEVSFISKRPRASTVTASMDSVVLKLDEMMMDKVGPVIREKIKSYLLTLLIKRLDNMNLAILEHMR